MELLLFIIGGRLYTWIEVLWRGYTHWTMFLLGGLCFVVMGLLNEHIFPWKLSLILQAVLSAIIITAFEFLTGCIVNLWFGWGIWDYSGLPFNLFGQVCLYYFLLWVALAVTGIILDDWIRYIAYLYLKGRFPRIQIRERPHYRLL